MESEHTPASTDLPQTLGQPALRALNAAGYRRLEQLSEVSEREIKRLRGVRPRAIEQLRGALNAKGLGFGP